ncbi:MAG: exosortase family protein XrtF [Flavobacteriales bacterium]|nr:MAG: exosortase family protein XrtF [Flavobacteriales bacterium]
MLKDFKPIIFILLRFAVIYIILLVSYQLYLNQFEGLGIDSFSDWVTQQVVSVQNWADYPTQIYHEKATATNWFYVKKEYVSRMVEGCNAMSVMILFVAFIFAFYKGAKTFLFAFGGLALLHLMNVLRIAGLNIVLRDYPEYGKSFHDYVFPAIIYGTVVVLWLVWIQFFAIKKEGTNEKN